jgi:hypothetical protein
MTEMANQIESLKRQKAFAWAKYYESEAERADGTNGIVIMLERSGIARQGGELVTPTELPPHITAEFMEMATKLNKEHTCPVCLDLVTSATIHITWCGHILCKGCYEQLKTTAGEAKPKCPACRKNI